MEFFRKSALDNRYEREENAEILKVSPPNTWTLIFLAVALLVATQMVLLLSPLGPPVRMQAVWYASGRYPVRSPIRGALKKLYVGLAESVQVGEPIAEISTADSRRLIIYSRQSGNVQRIFVRPGDPVATEDILLEMEVKNQIVGYLTARSLSAVTTSQNGNLVITNARKDVYVGSVRVRDFSASPIDAASLPPHLQLDAEKESLFYPVELQFNGNDGQAFDSNLLGSTPYLDVDFSGRRESLPSKLYHRYMGSAR